MSVALRLPGPPWPRLLVILASLSPALAPLLVACAVLASAGLAKVRRPAPTGLALARIGLPGSDPVVRAIGATEVAVALLAGLVGGPTAFLVVAAYLAFAAVATTQVARPGEAARSPTAGASATSAPVGPLHVAVNLPWPPVLAWAAAVGSEGLAPALADEPGARRRDHSSSPWWRRPAVQALLTDLPRLTALRAAA